MSNYNERILVVEDDKQISNFICFTLKNEGFSCVDAHTGQEAMNKLASEPVDLILLDMGLPDIDGMEVIRNVREWSEMPIIVVSARDQDREKVNALDSGADDYLTKPFSAAELMARIRVAIRHLHKQGGHAQQMDLAVGELRINLDKRLVYLDSEELHLTPMEYHLVSLFFKNMGKVLTTGYIVKEIWGASHGTDPQALRTLMAGLRRKIEKTPAMPRYIKTLIGVGYRLMDE